MHGFPEYPAEMEYVPEDPEVLAQEEFPADPEMPAENQGLADPEVPAVNQVLADPEMPAVNQVHADPEMPAVNQFLADPEMPAVNQVHADPEMPAVNLQEDPDMQIGEESKVPKAPFIEPLPTGQHAISKRMKASHLEPWMQSKRSLKSRSTIWCPLPWVHFGSILGPFWVHFGSILGQFWVHCGSILGQFLECRFIVLTSHRRDTLDHRAVFSKVVCFVYCIIICNKPKKHMHVQDHAIYIDVLGSR